MLLSSNGKYQYFEHASVLSTLANDAHLVLFRLLAMTS